MTRGKQKAPAALIHVDGHDLEWTLLRDQQWSSENDYQGITVAVRKAGVVKRELILKYPYLGVRVNGAWRRPDKPRVTPEIVESAVRAALEAGWEPESRGKPFHFEVPDDAAQ